MNHRLLTQKVLDNCLEYLNLEVNGMKVVCPYYMNIIEKEFLKLMNEAGISDELSGKVHQLYKENSANYGWYRGKGTAKEIESACVKIAARRGFPLENATSEGIRIFMNFVGLGVDCSGYIYNVLIKGFEELGMKNELDNSLRWADKERIGVSKASVGIFAGDASCVIPNISDLKPLDLILYKSCDGGYSHCAMVLEQEDSLFVTQSTLTSSPNGVRLDKLCIKNGMPRFDCNTVLGKTFEQRLNEGLIEFRRLKILNNLDDTGIEPVTSTMSM